MYTIKQLTEVPVEEFRKWTKKDLQERLKDMNKIISRRIAGFSSFQKGKGISESPALRKYRQAGADKLATSMKMRRYEMQREYMRGLYYLKSESSTASAWYKIQSKTLKSINAISGVKIRRRDYERFWDKYSRLIEERPDLALPENKYEAFRQVARMLEESYYAEKIATSSNFVETLTEQMDNMYEMAMSTKMDELGGMFKLKKSKGSESKKKKPFKSKRKKAGDILDVDSSDLDVDIDIDDLL